jgi:hypothetical protein
MLVRSRNQTSGAGGEGNAARVAAGCTMKSSAAPKKKSRGFPAAQV